MFIVNCNGKVVVIGVGVGVGVVFLILLLCVVFCICDKDCKGLVLLSVLWGLVVVGIFFELFFPGKFNLISVLFYLVMGLIFVFVPNHFFSSMPTQVMALVLCGVGLYCFGVIFYLWQKWPYHHAIWHFFVLGGGIVHFVAILVTVA